MELNKRRDRHGPGGGVAPEPPACPVCHARDLAHYARLEDRLLRATPGVFELRRCRRCLCVVQDPLPVPESLVGFYPRVYWWTSTGRPSRGIGEVLTRLEKRYRELVALDHIHYLERCARHSPGAGKSVLDIGCGGGLLLHLARKRGFDACGMDLAADAVEAARREYGLDVRHGPVGADLWEGRRFDFVTLFHVLEHLDDPGAALLHTKRHLKPGGNLIVQVPNVSSLQARLFGRRWYGLDVPRHLVNFSPEGLGLLLRGAGFRVCCRARFSLRDNPASIASSIAPALDPLARKARGDAQRPARGLLLELLYFGLVLASLPLALSEGMAGRGGTIWLHARPSAD